MRRAFTLIELLVVIAIVAILAAMLFPVYAEAKQAAKRSNCLQQLYHIGIANALYLNDYDDLMPWIPDAHLQLTPPVDAGGKRYAGVGAFMPLWAPYMKSVEIYTSSATELYKEPTDWRSHFTTPWSEGGVPMPEKGWSNYTSDLLGETNTASARFARGRSPLSVCDAKGVSVSEQEWLMSPFYEAKWWAFSHELWRVGGSEPPADGWSAHKGGRNQLLFDNHVKWVRKDIRVR
ncbi:MAG: hypothetical protein AMXMBFR81_04040 [Chthonomonas sp.]